MQVPACRGNRAAAFHAGVERGCIAMELQSMKLDRITSDPEILAGQPTIRRMPITVRRVIEALALCPNWDELRAQYPDLESEDIRQALHFQKMG